MPVRIARLRLFVCVSELRPQLEATSTSESRRWTAVNATAARVPHECVSWRRACPPADMRVSLSRRPVCHALHAAGCSSAEDHAAQWVANDGRRRTPRTLRKTSLTHTCAQVEAVQTEMAASKWVRCVRCCPLHKSEQIDIDIEMCADSRYRSFRSRKRSVRCLRQTSDRWQPSKPVQRTTLCLSRIYLIATRHNNWKCDFSLNDTSGTNGGEFRMNNIHFSIYYVGIL